MTSTSRRIKAVLFDWAGTTVDFGSRAPTQVFIEIFRSRGIDVTPAEVRGPMGRAKHDHIAALLAMPRIARAWAAKFGREATADDVQAMYSDFLPLQKRVLAAGSDVIPGVVDSAQALRERHVGIGSTTGYTRELMQVVAPSAAAQGYAPDVTICSDDVAAGRPSPEMNLLAAKRMGITSMASVVVVDDTPVGIQAGVAAGAIAVGVTETGNAFGLSQAELAALPAAERAARLREAEAEFRRAGAHYVIRSAAEIVAIVDSLEATTPLASPVT